MKLRSGKLGIRIAFDIDGTLVDTMSHLKIVMRTLYNLDNLAGPTFYDLYKSWKISHIILDAGLVCVFKHWQKTKIYSGVSKLMKSLWDETGEPVQFVTARSKNLASYTYSLVDRFMIDIPYQIAFATHETKHLFLENYIFFLEDRRKTAIDLVARGKIVFLVDQPWNQNMEYNSRLVRISGPAELQKYVKLFLTRKGLKQ